MDKEYCRRFYLLYSETVEFCPQVEGKLMPNMPNKPPSPIFMVPYQLREEGKDNPIIGLLICRSKDNTQAKYAFESSRQPIGISEYELEQFYPAKVEGTIPTIEEIETKLNQE